MICVESPEARFEETIEIQTNKLEELSIQIDPTFIHVCEENCIKPISYVSSEPCVCGIKVDGSLLKIKFSDLLPVPESLIVKLSGIRKGRKNSRFQEFTKEEMEKNVNFWSAWQK